MEEKKKQNDRSSSENNLRGNRDRQGMDKGPGQERGKAEQAKPENLKGKKVDGDPSQESDRPTS